MHLNVRHPDPSKDTLFMLGDGLWDARGGGLVATFGSSDTNGIWRIGFPESHQAEDETPRAYARGFTASP